MGYQWVVFVLFLQAACFHLPRLIWKHSEGGLMKMLVGNLTDPMMIINKGDRSDRIQFIKKYFKESMKSHHVWSCHHLQNGRHSRSFPQGFCHLRACSQPGPAINSKGAHYQQVRLARSGWRLLGDLLVVQEPQPHRNEGAFGGTQAGHGSRFKQLPTSLSFNGNGREGVQHVDEEKRERRK